MLLLMLYKVLGWGGIDEAGARSMECSLMGNAAVAVRRGSWGVLKVARVGLKEH